MGSSISGNGATAIHTIPPSLPPHARQAFFAAGCFWGVEHAFRHHFPNLLSTSVGYMGGPPQFPNPTYRQVCSGTTGHAEALKVVYDPEKVRYKELVEFFYRMHDPCDAGGQGPDRGGQYRSVCWYDGKEGSGEGEVARELMKRVGRSWFGGEDKVKTELRDWRAEGERWWDAEAYHQLYLQKNPGGYECPSHFVRKYPTVLDEPIEGEDGGAGKKEVTEAEKAILAAKV